MRLLDIATELRDLAVATEEERIDEDGVVLTNEDIDALFLDKEVAFEAKVEGCVRALRGLEAEAKAIREEEVRLARRRKAREQNAESLRRYVRDCMAIADTKRVTTATHTVSVSAGRPKLYIDNPTAVPPAFIESFEPHFAKDSIRAALTAGEEVPGAHMETGEPVLTIR